MNVTIRLATPDDYKRLGYLRWRFDNEDREYHDPEGQARFIEAFVERQGGDDLFHWLAEIGEHIVANLSVRKVKKVPKLENLDGHWGYLTNTYTLSEYRNQGIGSKLLSAVTRWAKEEQCELLIVWPSDRSYPFYERAGFVHRPDPLVLQLEQE